MVEQKRFPRAPRSKRTDGAAFRAHNDAINFQRLLALIVAALTNSRDLNSLRRLSRHVDCYKAISDEACLGAEGRLYRPALRSWDSELIVAGNSFTPNVLCYGSRESCYRLPGNLAEVPILWRNLWACLPVFIRLTAIIHWLWPHWLLRIRSTRYINIKT